MFFALPSVEALASGYNFNDQKAVDALIQKRVEERMRAIMPDYDAQKKKAEEYQRQLDAMPKPSVPPSTTPTSGPKMTCKVAGCSNELCVPHADGVQSPVGGATTCDYMSFYSCYQRATCAMTKTAEGQEVCRWQETGELRSCLQQKGGKIGLSHAGFK